MKLDQIQLHIQDAKVDLNISKPQQYMKQTPAKQTIKQPAATLEMSHTDAKLTIDSSQAYRELGLLTTKEAIEQAAQKGKSAVMSGIARRVSEGNEMMNLKQANGRATLANIAKRHDTFEQQKLGIQFIPSIGAVKISYQAGNLTIHAQANKPQIDVQLGDVVHNYTPGKVSGQLLQRESVETSVIKGE
ncbi:MAG: hypothetical protein KBT36_16105 [Kurthia sp.]|nr:hypothetical protein [Candidatus Kurthia equi]